MSTEEYWWHTPSIDFTGTAGTMPPNAAAATPVVRLHPDDMEAIRMMIAQEIHKILQADEERPNLLTYTGAEFERAMEQREQQL